MRRKGPIVAGALAALATLLLVGPVAVAVALLRSSSDARGPDLAAQILIGAFLLVLVALAYFAGWGAARLLQRWLGGRG